MDTGFAPGGNPFYFIMNRIQGRIAESVHGSKPLLGSPVDDGVLATPAMGVLVMDILFTQQESQFRQVFQDRYIGVKHKQAFKALAGFRRHLTLFVYGADNRYIVFQAGQIVHVAVTAGRMYTAGTGFQVNIVCQTNHGFTMIVFRERMLAFRKFHFTAFYRAQYVAQSQSCFRRHIIDQLAGHEQHFVTVFHKGILKIRVQRHRHVAGNSPGRGGPDYNINRPAVHAFRSLAIVFGQREFDINGRRLLVCIFNFRFRQCGFAMGAPVNRFQSFINVTLVGHGAKYANLLRFKRMLQGQIGMIPVAQHAQPFEFFPLDIHKLMGVGITFCPQIQRRHAVTVHTHSVETGMFNRHAVRIPAGNIRSIIALGIFIFNDDIFQYFIQRMPHMDMAVGIRRSVMEYPLGMPFMQFLFLFINLVFFPEF